MGSFNSSHLQQQEPPPLDQPEDQEHHHNIGSSTTSDPQIYHHRHHHLHAHQISHHHHHHHHQPFLMPRGLTTSLNSPTHIRQLLINCAELISQLDFSSARRLLSILSSNSSPFGDSAERLTHQFVKALSLRLNTNPSAAALTMTPISAFAASSSNNAEQLEEADNNEEALHSCYLTLNQITPFIRFSHLTANQAILEAIDSSHHSIHILDFDIMHGVQWPPLMQALADRAYNNSSLIAQPPPMLRITATGHNLTFLLRTGDRLLRFAQSLGLSFQFHPLVTLTDSTTTSASSMNDVINPQTLGLLPNEALAVNCVLYLHTLVTDDARDITLFLHKIKSLNPKIVTVANKEANHNHPQFLNRFMEALDHYGAVFDSLEATLPPNSRERMAVEEGWFGREIRDVVGAVEDEKRKQRHERFETYWEVMLRRAGFEHVALSPFAVSQAKLLLRLHYPSEGYQLKIVNDSFFLGWQNRPLFSVSSWH